MAKRIKQVFSNLAAIAPLWASQSQDSARCSVRPYRDGSGRGSQGYFEGKEIVSYGSHYLLGRLMEFNGVKIAAVNHTKYSNSTTQHSSYAYSAAKEAGHLTVAYRTADGVSNSVYVSDEDLAKIIKDSLKSDEQALSDELTKIAYNPYSAWSADHLKERVDEFNALVISVRMGELAIDVPEEYYADARQLGRIKSKIRESKNSIKQLSIDFSKEE